MVTRMETMTIKPRITLDPENDAWKEYHAAKFVEPLLMHRPRRNPNWGQPPAPIPDGPTEFEMRAKRLKLSPEMYVGSNALRNWCPGIETDATFRSGCLKSGTWTWRLDMGWCVVHLVRRVVS
jgi:hypothetical protein